MKTALDALWASLVRTLTPMLVGAIVGVLTAWGLPLDPEFAPALAIVIALVFQVVYYVLLRLLVLYVAPSFSKLLVSSARPLLYAKPDADGVPVVTGLQQTAKSAVVQVRRE